MRDIKFRGKRVDNGEWVYGSLVSFGKPYIVTSKHGFSHYRATASKTYMHIKDAHKVIPKTVGQFTGLLDKNSVEIYEGDVVTCEDFNTMNYSVLFQGGAFGYVNRYGGLEWLWIDDETGASDLEVIGNIHDNPDFLKGKE